MPAFAVGDKIQLLSRCQMFGQAGIWARQYRVTAVVDVDWDKTKLANAFFIAIKAATKALMTADGSFVYVAAKKIGVTPPDPEFRSTEAAEAGTAGGDPLPTQVSGIITIQTAFAGRKYRGRMYVPFPSEGMNDVTGKPSAAYLVLLANLANVMLADPVTLTDGGNSIDLEPILWHRATNTFDVVTSARMNQKWATQKRRGIYGRPNPV